MYIIYKIKKEEDKHVFKKQLRLWDWDYTSKLNTTLTAQYVTTKNLHSLNKL